MNRTIKFRAWDETNKKFTYWNRDTPEDNFNLAFCLDPQIGVEVSQFTGLLDKNGKEIYEGDVVQARDAKWEIIWLSKFACFALKNPEDEWFPNLDLDTPRIEIIGNIYENSDLLV